MASNKPAGGAARLRRPAAAAVLPIAAPPIAAPPSTAAPVPPTAAAGVPARGVPASGTAPDLLAAAGYTLSTLLMVGSDPVIIDAAEDDNLHFMSEHIDPA